MATAALLNSPPAQVSCPGTTAALLNSPPAQLSCPGGTGALLNSPPAQLSCPGGTAALLNSPPAQLSCPGTTAALLNSPPAQLSCPGTTAALLNSPPAHLSCPGGTGAPSSGADATTMHVARPKSAKGRRRPSFSCSQSLGACPCRVPPPPPAAARQQLNSRRVPSWTPALPAGRVPPGEIPALLQRVPQRSCSSLNRYRVLPSIGCGAALEALAERAGGLKVCEAQEDPPRGGAAAAAAAAAGEQEPAGALSERDGPDVESSHVQSPPEKPGWKTRQQSPPGLALGVEELPREESELLLLAVRSPSGQRFEHCFKPSDSLQAVLAVAEQKASSSYKHCSLETMEVPRRTFSDLSRSLHECGILHKSVLCIRLKEQQDADL